MCVIAALPSTSSTDCTGLPWPEFPVLAHDPIQLVSDPPLPKSLDSVTDPDSADPESEAVASAPVAVASFSRPDAHLPSDSLCAVGWWGIEVGVCGRGSSWMGGKTWVRAIVTGGGADEASSVDLLLLLPWWPLWRRLARGTS